VIRPELILFETERLILHPAFSKSHSPSDSEIPISENVRKLHASRRPIQPRGAGRPLHLGSSMSDSASSH
jgi:hypothetical protein